MTGGAPLVSIIMNCYNGGRYVREAISSVISQSYGNWEVIFWDNASTDDSASIAKGFNDKRIRYFRSAATVPLGQARNLAVREAKGEFISFLDSDDVLMPEKLRLQVGFFAANTDVAFLYSNAWLKYSSGKRRILYHEGAAMASGDIFGPLLVNNFINLQTVMFRRSLLERFEEWFDPELEVAEEYDLFLRMLYGQKAAYMGEPLVEYRIHESMGTVSKFKSIPWELERIAARLFSTFPDLKENYGENLRFYNGRTALMAATQRIIEGDRRGAISTLRPYRGLSWKFLFIYAVLHISGALALLVLSRKVSGARAAVSKTFFGRILNAARCGQGL